MSASVAVKPESESVPVYKTTGRSNGKSNALRKLDPRQFKDRYTMLQGLSGDAIKTLGELIQPDKPDMIRLHAAKEILNRVDGTPRQQVQVTASADMTTLHLDALRALAAQAPEIIDITPQDNGQDS